MKIPITRMQGNGNQFLVIDAYYGFPKNLASLISDLCAEYGDTIDQILVVSKGKKADIAFAIFNRDTSAAKQCLNGARCVAHFSVEKKYVTSSSFTLENASGILPVQFKSAEEIVLTLPIPQLKPWQREGILVDVGNPHLIFFKTNIAMIDVNTEGFYWQTQIVGGVNVGFVEVVNSHQLKLRTFERGCGETKACGSSALASVFVGWQTQKLSDSVQVHCSEGAITIRREQNAFKLIGPSVLGPL